MKPALQNKPALLSFPTDIKKYMLSPPSSPIPTASLKHAYDMPATTVPTADPVKTSDGQCMSATTRRKMPLTARHWKKKMAVARQHGLIPPLNRKKKVAACADSDESPEKKDSNASAGSFDPSSVSFVMLKKAAGRCRGMALLKRSVMA